MPQVMPRQNRPAGEYSTPESDVPARLQNEISEIVIIVDLAAQDLADETLVISMWLETTTDGTNWVVSASGENWTGGRIGRNGQPVEPIVGWMSSANGNLQKARFRWTQNKTARSGLFVDIIGRTINRANLFQQ